jgi:hypothetical protein
MMTLALASFPSMHLSTPINNPRVQWSKQLALHVHMLVQIECEIMLVVYVTFVFSMEKKVQKEPE